MHHFYFRLSLTKKLKLKFLLFLNQLIHPCRMVWKKKPDALPDALCYLCASKGGWLRCRIPKRLKKLSSSK